MKKILRSVKWFFRYHPVVAGCMILCLISVLSWGAFDTWAKIKLRLTIRSIEREGVICQYSGFEERCTPSPGEILSEFSRIGEALSSAERKYMSDTGNFDVAAFVAGEGKLIEEADTFLDRNPQLFFVRDFAVTCQNELPETHYCRIWARINAERFSLLTREGRIEDAVRLFHLTARLRDYLLNDLSFFNGWLAAFAVERSRIELLSELALTGEIAAFSPEQLRRWEQDAETVEKVFRERLSAVAEGIMCMYSAIGMNPGQFRMEARGPANSRRWLPALFTRPIVRLDAARELEFCRESLRILSATENLEQVKEEIYSLKMKFFGFKPSSAAVIGSLLSNDGSLELFPSAAGKVYAGLRTLRAGLAAERFLRDHGRPPATLEELVPEYLPEVPRNPFTGDPLKLESGRLERLLPAEQGMGQFFPEKPEIEPFEGFRIYGGGDQAITPVGSTRMSRRGELPVWCRRWKTE